MAYEAIAKMNNEGLVSAKAKEEYTDAYLFKSYRKSAAKGILKVMSKMGISTLQSYKGAQASDIFYFVTVVVFFCYSVLVVCVTVIVFFFMPGRVCKQRFLLIISSHCSLIAIRGEDIFNLTKKRSR